MNKWLIHAPLGIILLLLVHVYPFALHAAETFEARGVVTITHYAPSGRVNSASNEFRVLLAGCKVVIRVGAGGDRVIEFMEHRSDESESSFLIKYLPTPQDKERKPVNAANLTLYAEPVPISNAGLIPAVWLAFGSRCYYKTNGAGSVAPVAFFGYNLRNNQMKLPAQWRFSPEDPHFLSQLLELGDGHAYRDGENNNTVVEDLPNHLIGVTNLEYSVSTWTNIGDMTLPVSFRLVRHQPSPDRRKMVLSYVMEGTTAFLSTSSQSQIEGLEIPNVTRVLDHRLTLEGQLLPVVSYWSTNGTIRSLEELKASSLFGKAITEAKYRNIPSNRRTPLYWIVAALLLGFFPVVVLAGKKAMSKKHQDQ